MKICAEINYLLTLDPQDRDSVAGPRHGVLQDGSGLTQLLVRVCLPIPQLTEHLLQAP